MTPSGLGWIKHYISMGWMTGTLLNLNLHFIGVQLHSGQTLSEITWHVHTLQRHEKRTCNGDVHCSRSDWIGGSSGLDIADVTVLKPRLPSIIYLGKMKKKPLLIMTQGQMQIQDLSLLKAIYLYALLYLWSRERSYAYRLCLHDKLIWVQLTTGS